MVLTGKEHLRPNIWPETFEHVENMGSMMNTIWNMEAIYWQKASRRPDCPLFLTGKEAKHVYTLLFFVIGVNKITNLGIDFGFNHGF